MLKLVKSKNTIKRFIIMAYPVHEATHKRRNESEDRINKKTRPDEEVTSRASAIGTAVISSQQAATNFPNPSFGTIFGASPPLASSKSPELDFPNRRNFEVLNPFPAEDLPNFQTVFSPAAEIEMSSEPSCRAGMDETLEEELASSIKRISLRSAPEIETQRVDTADKTSMEDEELSFSFPSDHEIPATAYGANPLSPEDEKGYETTVDEINRRTNGRFFKDLREAIRKEDLAEIQMLFEALQTLNPNLCWHFSRIAVFLNVSLNTFEFILNLSLPTLDRIGELIDLATKKHYGHFIKYLLTRFTGSDHSLLCVYARSAFITICQNWDEETFEILVRHGVRVSSTEFLQGIREAASHGSFQAINKIITDAARVVLPHIYPLVDAALKGDLLNVEELLPRKPPDDLLKILFLCASASSNSMLFTRLSRIKEPDKITLQNATRIAAARGHIQLLNLFLKNHPSEKACLLDAIIESATEFGRPDVLKFVQERGQF